ncbi:MAG: ParB/RepB/Spo0J family partition protein [Gammaproteobacteria bacterium]
METITVHAMFSKGLLKDIPIQMLHSGTYQPRHDFSEETLESLSKTIAQVGILEPLIIRASKSHAGKFEIVAGERRWRAAQRAGLSVVPCLISNYTNEQAAQIALIENKCREALNPIEEACAMQRLTDEFRYTHDEVSMLLGVSRSHVSNLLRLLRMDGRVQHWLRQGNLSEGHGKLLAGVPYDNQYYYAYHAIKKGWSVRTLDEAIKAGEDKKLTTNKSKKTVQPMSLLETQLTEQLGFPMKVTINKNEAGHFRIPFHDRAQMQMILDKWGITDSIYFDE